MVALCEHVVLYCLINKYKPTILYCKILRPAITTLQELSPFEQLGTVYFENLSCVFTS